MSPILNFPALQQVLQNGMESLLFLGTVGGILLVAIVHTLVSDRRSSASQRRPPGIVLLVTLIVLAVMVIGILNGGALPQWLQIVFPQK